VNTAQAATASDICSKCCHHIMPLSSHGEDLCSYFLSLHSCFYLKPYVALNGLLYADVPLRKYSLSCLVDVSEINDFFTA